ncbi:MAG: helix-turn-helix transcriptional regulator [Phycisphaerae bacterium]
MKLSGISYGFGRTARQLRQRLGVASIREFAEVTGYEVTTLRRIENGTAPPWRSRAKLERFAFKLGLRPNTPGYAAFIDRGLLDAGQLPNWGCETPLQAERFVELLRLLRRRPSLVIDAVELLRTRLGVVPPDLPDVDPHARVVIGNQFQEKRNGSPALVEPVA